MSEYLPSFIVEPVLRQARRLSRLSSGEESPGFLPTVPDFQRWYPTRLWHPSLPLSSDEEELNRETAVQSIARTIQLWTNQINDLELDSVPSTPPLGSMDQMEIDQPRMLPQTEPDILFSPLEPVIPERTSPVQLAEHRNESETSLNPAQELSNRSRILSDDNSRNNSTSDPLVPSRSRGQSYDNDRRENTNTTNQYTTDGYVRRRDGSEALPEDDGMGILRQKIRAVWAGSGTGSEKSKQVHELMTESYHNTHQKNTITRPARSTVSLARTGSPTSMDSVASQHTLYNLELADLERTYTPVEPDDHNDGEEKHEAQKPHLGCIHYRRNVKMQCATCERWYTCRFCHDDVEDHVLPRRDTKHMLCMLCNTPQPVSQVCKTCNEQTACYYCAICKLWNNDPAKTIYHCDDCGICRLGEGLGKDFFHCKRCAACMSIQAESTHKCIEKSTKCDCPICGEYMFTSNKPVAFMRCGHSIHETCFADWCNTSYKCPICSKSIANMESQFRRLDRHIEEQPMPEEYRQSRAYIFCNDCNSRSITAFHWLGLKCNLCESYNTTQLELLGPEGTPTTEQQQERFNLGEASITASQSHTPTRELTSPAMGGRTMSLSGIATPRSPTAITSPWIMPHSPTRSVRSPSPIVGGYFGTTGQRAEAPIRGTTLLEHDEDDEDLDFWGRRSPPNPNPDPTPEGSDEDSGSEDDDGEAMQEDEEEDIMDLVGHR